MSVSPIELCRRSIQAHSKSFALASRLLAADVRDVAVVVYAFCRRTDDLVDMTQGPEQIAALDRLERELAQIVAGAPPDDPVLRAFAEVMAAYGIPADYPRDLLAGMRMDVDGVRYRSLDDLLLYCFRVAGSVGLMMCHAMGVRQPEALRRAAHLGIAMQLTNICRDVAEDWAMGRLYLPDSLLDGQADALHGRLGRPLDASDAAILQPAMRRLLAEAERYYTSADLGLADLSPRSALAVRSARLIYAAIGTRVANQGYDPRAGRAVVSKAAKLALVGQALGAALIELPGRLLAPFRPSRLETVVRFPGDVLPV